MSQLMELSDNSKSAWLTYIQVLWLKHSCPCYVVGLVYSYQKATPGSKKTMKLSASKAGQDPHRMFHCSKSTHGGT